LIEIELDSDLPAYRLEPHWLYQVNPRGVFGIPSKDV